MESGGYWYSMTACSECNAGRLAFAVRRDGRTCYLLCVECGANFAQPPGPDDDNSAFDTPTDELADPPRWASRQEIEARGWDMSVAGHNAGDAEPLGGN